MMVSLDGRCKSCMYALIEPKSELVGGCQCGRKLGIDKWELLCDGKEVECEYFVQHPQSPDSCVARYEILQGARETADAQFDALLHELMIRKTRYAIRKPWINIGINPSPFGPTFIERRY